MKLKPCPFCGGEPETGVSFVRSDTSDGVFFRAIVRCKNCKTDKNIVFKAASIYSSNNPVPFSEYLNVFNDVEELWNTRV